MWKNLSTLERTSINAQASQLQVNNNVDFAKIFKINNYKLAFIEPCDGFFQIVVSNKTEQRVLPILFDKQYFKVICKTIHQLKLKLKHIEFETFCKIVTGCIKIHSQYAFDYNGRLG